MYNPFSLKGKKIMVTGASSGIGRAIAIECSKMGAIVILTARDEARLNETLSQMEGEGHIIVAADFNNEEDRKYLIDYTPALDGLVSCAGIVETLPFSFITIEALNNIMNVNFTVPALITAELVKKKKIIRNASIVFISSIDGPVTVHAANSMYAASKGAVTALAKNMAVDLASKNIRVNCILPGMTDTSLIHSEKISQKQLEMDMKLYPLKRYGKPEEIAYAAVYFLSDASVWTTGANLVIDGGYTLL